MKIMKRVGPLALFISTLVFLVVGLGAAKAAAQEPPIDPEVPRGTSVDQITQRFAAQELEFKRAREQYTYRQAVQVQTLDESGGVEGQYDETFDVTFDDRGQRVIKQVSPARSTLKNVSVTKEDIDDIRNRLPFVLTSDELGDYEINYVGRQRLESGEAYLFDVTPKRIESGKRYFEGRIWVDANQYQIVKSFGKTVPNLYTRAGENLFPSFTTNRSLIDGKYWFPTSTRADDVLHFSNQDVRVREIVNYTNYHRFGSTSRVIFNGEELPSGSDQQQPVSVQGGESSSQSPARPVGTPQSAANSRVPTRSSSTSAAAGTVTDQITALERRLSEAIVKRDLPAWQRLLADGYTDVDSAGTVRDLNAMADEIQAHNYDSAEIKGLEVRIYNDTVVVVGTRTFKENTPRGLQTTSKRFTDVFLLRSGEWRLASSQSTPLRGPTAAR
jgi:Domain of unknown function (DUF4440)